MKRWPVWPPGGSWPLRNPDAGNRCNEVAVPSALQLPDDYRLAFAFPVTAAGGRAVLTEA
ncbi:hypothetical protein A6M21_11570 [Desulfotomaculum copahuensis]|uniref:Uncharacterized protein n=1 Tax=Desulfotomaculum copahuensis TaxID=1838280 RepID=A0A1B7LDI9_9FIRM|nr:hypothetical protein A6M21_11570 [Desulfotomaculum copahuensis]